MAHVGLQTDTAKHGRVHYQAALGTRLAILSFVAWYADDVVSSRYEAVGADLLLTDHAYKTLGVPLAPSVFVLLCTYAVIIEIKRLEHLFTTNCIAVV